MESPRSSRVLVLDDDENVGRTIGAVVESMGMEWRLATTAAGFFSLLDQWPPQHILLDLMMPDMDGVEVMAELASRGCDAHIVIVSGVGSRVLDAAQRVAAKHGLNVEVLPKPIRRRALESVLTRHGVEHAAQRDPTGIFGAIGGFNEHDLRAACRGRQFRLVLQPKIRCRDEALVGFEALVRWHHPQLGVILPDAFIPLAESTGVIADITLEVLRQGLDWLASLSPDDGLTLAVNVSARCLSDPNLTGQLTQLCRDRSLSPERLVLELTETSALEDSTAALDLLTRLRVRGFQLSIDDFGTGYSTMMQLARLPFSEIKIDKAFVITAEASAESRSIVRATVDLGRRLGIAITAEGVEQRSVLSYLREIECDYAQGYLIAHPMEQQKAHDWAQRYRPD